MNMFQKLPRGPVAPNLLTHTELWAALSSCVSVALASLTASYHGKEGKNSDPFWTGEETIAPNGYRACWSPPAGHITCLTSSSAVVVGSPCSHPSPRGLGPGLSSQGSGLVAEEVGTAVQVSVLVVLNLTKQPV